MAGLFYFKMYNRLPVKQAVFLSFRAKNGYSYFV